MATPQPWRRTAVAALLAALVALAPTQAQAQDFVGNETRCGAVQRRAAAPCLPRLLCQARLAGATWG